MYGIYYIIIIKTVILPMNGPILLVEGCDGVVTALNCKMACMLSEGT